MAENEPIVKEYAEGDPILLNGTPIGTVTKVEARGGTTFVTASLDPVVAQKMEESNVYIVAE